MRQNSPIYEMMLLNFIILRWRGRADKSTRHLKQLNFVSLQNDQVEWSMKTLPGSEETRFSYLSIIVCRYNKVQRLYRITCTERTFGQILFLTLKNAKTNRCLSLSSRLRSSLSLLGDLSLLGLLLGLIRRGGESRGLPLNSGQSFWSSSYQNSNLFMK